MGNHDLAKDCKPRILFATHASLISRGLEGLVLLSLLSGAIPLVPAQPIWWLRLSDAVLGLAPVILLAVVLLRLAALFLNWIPSDSPMPGRSISYRLEQRSFRTASRWAILFALMVPLQLLGFTWLWFDSERVLTSRLLEGERSHSVLQRSLATTSSEGELRDLLARSSPGPLPTIPAGSLADRKRQLSQAIDANWATLSANLHSERSAMLRNSIPGSVRVLLGAMIVSAILFMITREI